MATAVQESAERADDRKNREVGSTMNPSSAIEWMTDVWTGLVRGLSVIWTHAVQPVLIWAWQNPKGLLVALVLIVVALITIYADGSTDRTNGPR